MTAAASRPGGQFVAGTFLQDITTITTYLDVTTDRNVFPAQSAEPLQSAASEDLREVHAKAAKLLPEGIFAQALLRTPDGGYCVGTNRGLFRYSGNEILHAGEDGLPILGVTHLAPGPDNSLWMGTPHGAIRLRAGLWRYYAGRRWLPDDHVTDLKVEANGDCLVTTSTGTSRIAFLPMTFPQKAAHYERITAARHNRGGYVTDCRLTRAGDLDSFLYEASDNDGLWTSLYICAESFRYAVTGEAEARDLAGRSLHALLDLVHITGIPGFPARALIRTGERVHQSDPGPNWYPSPVEPDVLYKNDTSSDEILGHYLAWYVYSTLVADADERAAIAATCRAVTNHILDHHYTLVGPTGKRTTWGVWSPEILNDDPEWAAERGLNSLAILSHLKVAHHLCGDARFAEAYHSLIVQYAYSLNTVGQKILPPEGENNHSDDELAACAYYPLLMLETDPALRTLYLRSLERTHAILRPEQSPFYNFLYGALTGGEPCDVEACVRRLQDAPWDLTHWTMRNSHRADILHDPRSGRFGEKQALHVLSPREQRVTKWNHNPYALDGGNEGMGEEDGTFWLLPYWLGRFYGIIAEGGEKEA